MQRKIVPVLNSLVFVRDSISGDVPDITEPGCLWQNATGLAISCLPDSDGDTEITLSAAEPPSIPGLVRIFDGTIETRSGWLVVEVLPDITLFRVHATGPETRIRVWTDGFPDTKIISLTVY